MEQFAAQLKTHLHEQGYITVNQIIIERGPGLVGRGIVVRVAVA